MFALATLPIAGVLVQWPDDITEPQRKAVVCRACGMTFRAICDMTGSSNDSVFKWCAQYAHIIDAIRTHAETFRQSIFDTALVMAVQIGYDIGQQFLAHVPDARAYVQWVKALQSVSQMMQPAQAPTETAPTGKRVTRSQLKAATAEFRALRDAIVGKPSPTQP